MLDWWNTPPNPEHVWHGFKYFQLVRIGMILQGIGGCFVLADLLSPGFKQLLSNKADQIMEAFPRFEDFKNALKEPEPEKPMSKRKRVLLWILMYLLGAGVTAFVASNFEYQGHGWHHLSFWTVIIISLVVGIAVGWLLWVAVLLTFMVVAFVLATLSGAPLGAAWLLAWSVNIKRLKGSMIVIGFVFFLAGTLLAIAFT